MRQHVIAVVKGIAPTCSSSGTTDSLVCLVCEEEIASPITLPSGSGEHYFDGNFCEYCDFSLKIYNKCEHGDDEKDEDGDKVFVSWIKEKKGKDATCSKYGYNDWSYCEECFAIIDAPTQIAPTAHDLKVVEGFAATALTSGLSDGYVCENTPCKLIVKHQEILPAVTEEMLSDGSEKLGGKLDYVKNDDGTTCTITGIGSCTVDELVIPEFINGLRVTAIGKEAFKNETSLESVTIPKYVSEIGKKAFSGCSSLETVVLPDCADVAGDAFASTSNVEFEFTHSLVYIAEVEATRCDRIGTVEHYVCVYCNERYADAATKEQLFNVRDTIEHDFEEGECRKCHTSYEEAVIISINTPDTITVDKGTLRKDLVLPTTVVGVRDLDDEDDVYVNLEVHWDLSEYDGETAGTYEITGYVSFNEYVARKKSGRTEGLGDTVTLKIKVK